VATESSSHDTLVSLVLPNGKLQVSHECNKINCALTSSQNSGAAGLSRLVKFTTGICSAEKDGNLDEFKHSTDIFHHTNAMQLPFDSVEKVNSYAP
jgi:hypothetical protein